MCAASSHALEASFYADPTPRPAGGVALIGDSTTYSYFDGVPQSLVAEGWGPFQLEARSGRRTVFTLPGATSGLDAVRRIRAGGFDPPVWIVGLGTNDVNVVARTPGGPDALIATMLAEIGPGRSVVWVNVYSHDDPATTAAFNAALDRAAALSPSFHVADWFTLANANPEWFYADGIHTNLVGAVARNAFVARAAKVAGCPPQSSPPAKNWTATITEAVGAAVASKPAVRLCRAPLA